MPEASPSFIVSTCCLVVAPAAGVVLIFTFAPFFSFNWPEVASQVLNPPPASARAAVWASTIGVLKVSLSWSRPAPGPAGDAWDSGGRDAAEAQPRPMRRRGCTIPFAESSMRVHAIFSLYRFVVS